MKIKKTKLKDLLIIETNIYKDNRGFFKEVDKLKISKKNLFLIVSLIQKNTLRGLHLQRNKPQAKILTVVHGKILDVVVDLRKNSKTYGKHFSIIIEDKSNFSLYIPENFAHGFFCMSKNCAVYYKCSNYRNAQSETTIKWNDPDLKIKWPNNKPILSKKDAEELSLKIIK